MTHTNFKKIEGIPESPSGQRFIRSKGRIFPLEPRKHEQEEDPIPDQKTEPETNRAIV